MLKTSSDLERNIPSEQAYKHILNIIKSEQLELEIKTNETYVFDTPHVFLTDKVRNLEFVGCGKGVGIQAQVSALFEAYEHYISHVKINEHNIQTMQADSGALDSLIDAKEIPANFIELIGGKEVSLPFIELTELNKSSSLWYPFALTNPYYNGSNEFDDTSSFKNITHLSTSSGISSGISFLDAMIHGINEAIERDATSLFLFSAFIKKQKIKIIDKATLPKYLQEYIVSIESEFEDELYIINITTKLGIPTFCVTFSKHQATIPPKGWGTSLSKEYAVERALLEALQPVQLRNTNLDKVERNTFNRLSKYPLLQQAAIADIKPILAAKNYEICDFNTIPSLYTNQNLSEQLTLLEASLNKNGYKIFFHIIHSTDNFCCVKVIIPGFSNLYLLQLGKIISPDVQHLNARITH